MKRVKSNQLPKWFDLEKYKLSTKFDLKAWVSILLSRVLLFHLSIEHLRKYREFFEKQIPGDENPLWIAQHYERIRANSALEGNDEVPGDLRKEWHELAQVTGGAINREPGRSPTTVRPLPTRYVVRAIARAQNENTALSAMLLSVSEKVWQAVQSDGDVKLDSSTLEYLDQPFDLLKDQNAIEDPNFQYNPILHYDPYLHLEVSIQAPDSIIIDNFKEWLKEAKKAHGSSLRNFFTPKEIKKWSKNQLIPYIDLTLWARLEGVKITDAVMGNALFPNEYDKDRTAMIADTVRPKAKWLVQTSVVSAIMKQISNMEQKI